LQVLGAAVTSFNFEAALNTLNELVKQLEMKEKFAE
jgi:exonuclease VII small subunit